MSRTLASAHNECLLSGKFFYWEKVEKNNFEVIRVLLRQKGSKGKIAERINKVCVEIMKLWNFWPFVSSWGRGDIKNIRSSQPCSWQTRRFDSLIELEKQRKELGITKVDRTWGWGSGGQVAMRREMSGKWAQPSAASPTGL